LHLVREKRCSKNCENRKYEIPDLNLVEDFIKYAKKKNIQSLEKYRNEEKANSPWLLQILGQLFKYRKYQPPTEKLYRKFNPSGKLFVLQISVLDQAIFVFSI